MYNIIGIGFKRMGTVLIWFHFDVDILINVLSVCTIIMSHTVEHTCGFNWKINSFQTLKFISTYSWVRVVKVFKICPSNRNNHGFFFYKERCYHFVAVLSQRLKYSNKNVLWRNGWVEFERIKAANPG